MSLSWLRQIVEGKPSKVDGFLPINRKTASDVGVHPDHDDCLDDVTIRAGAEKFGVDAEKLVRAHVQARFLACLPRRGFFQGLWRPRADLGSQKGCLRRAAGEG